MECHSCSITILDGRSQTSHPQWCHRTSLHSLLLQQFSTAAMKPAWRNNIQSLPDHLKWCFWMRTHTRRWMIWEWEWAPCLYHISTSENLSFNPATPLNAVDPHPAHSLWRLRSHSSVCHHLTFSSFNEESPVRINTPKSSLFHGRVEPASLVLHQKNYHHTFTPDTDDPFQDATAEEEEEYFPTAPLDDDIWLEGLVPDRHLCIHVQSQPYYRCSYPCPYSLNLLPSTPEDASASYYKMMDLSDISDLKDVMTTTSDEDIPDLEDIFGLWTQTMLCVNIYHPWTLSKWTNAELSKHDRIHL